MDIILKTFLCSLYIYNIYYIYIIYIYIYIYIYIIYIYSLKYTIFFILHELITSTFLTDKSTPAGAYRMHRQLME